MPFSASRRALVGGQVQVMLDFMAESIEYIRTAICGHWRRPTHSEAVPNLPTLSDFVPGCETSVWVALPLVPQSRRTAPGKRWNPTAVGRGESE
jgi:hypothetical protein